MCRIFLLPFFFLFAIFKFFLWYLFLWYYTSSFSIYEVTYYFICLFIFSIITLFSYRTSTNINQKSTLLCAINIVFILKMLECIESTYNSFKMVDILCTSSETDLFGWLVCKLNTYIWVSSFCLHGLISENMNCPSLFCRNEKEHSIAPTPLFCSVQQFMYSLKYGQTKSNGSVKFHCQLWIWELPTYLFCRIIQ